MLRHRHAGERSREIHDTGHEVGIREVGGVGIGGLRKDLVLAAGEGQAIVAGADPIASVAAGGKPFGLVADHLPALEGRIDTDDRLGPLTVISALKAGRTAAGGGDELVYAEEFPVFEGKHGDGIPGIPAAFEHSAFRGIAGLGRKILQADEKGQGLAFLHRVGRFLHSGAGGQQGKG